jgi:hypothetical protein
MRRYESIAGITVGAAGSDSTIPVPVNRRLHLLRLYASGIVSGSPAYGADIVSDVQIYVGTTMVRNVTLQECLDIAKGNGRTITPSATVGVPIFFTEPWRASVMDEQVSAWDVFGQPAVTIKARTKSGVTSPDITAVLDYDDGFTTDSSGKRVLNIIKQEPVNLGSLGTSADILSPVIPVDLPIQRIWVYPESGVTVSRVKVTINDSLEVFNMSQNQNINFLADYGCVAEAGNGKVFPVFFDMNQQMFDGLPPVRTLKLSLTQSAAGVVKLLLERRAPAYI